MKIAAIICIGILLIGSCAHGQQHKFVTDHPLHRSGGNGHRSTVADLAEDAYDVKYIKFNLNVSNTSTAISGDVLTYAKVTAASMSSYVFELDTAYTIDSAKINGVLHTVGGSDSIRSIALGTPLTSGSMFTAQIFYHGSVASSGPFTLGGVFNITDPHWGVRTLFTISEAYHANRWWPCKQSLRDKIDSVDMWVTVPDPLKVGSNGLLQHVTHVDATHSRYEWKERYPINYYLISIAVGPYTDYSYYMHFTGSSDSMLIQNYIYDIPSCLPTYKDVLDSTGLMIDYFSGLFGLYPFVKEKYGHCMVYWGGAEENQTMTTIGSGALNAEIVAHELGHQWFGDNVTCSTWRDIVMNEGFASYASYLYYEHFYGREYANNAYIIESQISVKNNDSGAVYVNDTTSEYRIFSGRLTYDKGACVLHTLRSVVDNDSNYFQIYRNYQRIGAGRNGSVEDFKNTAKGLLGPVVHGINLDTFFNQWIYLQGYPKYLVHWNQAGRDVHIRLTQTTSDPESVPLFKLPVELTLHSASGDTTVRVLNNQPVQDFHFTWPESMSAVYIDPNSWLVCQRIAIIHDTTLNVPGTTIEQLAIMPNPATSGWSVTHVPANSDLTVIDLNGRPVWQYNNGSAERIIIPSVGLLPGMYMLDIVVPGGVHSSYKLIRE